MSEKMSPTSKPAAKPIVCMLAPNGARRGKADHPCLPLTPAETAAAAKVAQAAGACALHLHVRDADGGHTLSPARYGQAIDVIDSACGPDMLIQITTEAVGVYEAEQQIEVIYETRPAAVSLAVRELARARQRDLSELDRWMRAHGVLPQWIIYDLADLKTYRRWVRQGVLCGAAYPVLFVLGAYDPPVSATVDMLPPFLESLDAISSWMVCAFGANEALVMEAAAKRGGHIRVGFENNLWRADGEAAADNAELAAAAVAAAKRQGREPATAAQTRQILTPAW